MHSSGANSCREKPVKTGFVTASPGFQPRVAKRRARPPSSGAPLSAALRVAKRRVRLAHIVAAPLTAALHVAKRHVRPLLIAAAPSAARRHVAKEGVRLRRVADNFSKELPRIPAVTTAADFWVFSLAGRTLADLHLGYETVPMHPCELVTTGAAPLTDADYRVEKMRYGKNGKDKDLTTLHYNARITVKGIPLQAYEYVVNGKPALDWVVERQCVKTDIDSSIVNYANDWAVETMGNPRYPLELFLRVITVSLETMKVVEGLPGLGI